MWPQLTERVTSDDAVIEARVQEIVQNAWYQVPNDLMDKLVGGIIITGVDGTPDGYEAIKDGRMTGTVAQDGGIISGPDIITRGFIYVKESEELMEELRCVAMEAIERCQRKRIRDWTTVKTAIKNDLSGYLYKTTKRNPMILPVITEL